MIFFFLLLFCLLVVPVSLMLFKWLIGSLESRYEEYWANKNRKEREKIVQAGSQHWKAIHQARIASDPEYRARNEAYITKLRAGVVDA
jgi:hypothetical protein